MKATLVRIGNSRGIRIPKPVIDQCGFRDEVELVIHQHELVIRPQQASRAGWDYAFKKMAERGEDRLLDETLTDNQWDKDSWQWE